MVIHNMTENIFDWVRAQKSTYESDTIPLMDGIDYSQYETIKQNDYYWSSKYMENAHDEIIGDYPFDNISKYRILLEARATDFDIKHIEIEPKDSDRVTRVKAMVATKAIQNRLHKIKFGVFLNDLCITRPKHGGVLVKKTEDGVYVSKWENLVTDQSDIMAGLRIERHYLTPSEMLKKKGSWVNVVDAIKTADEWRDKSLGNDHEEAKTQGNLIEVIEIQGDMTKAMLNEAQAIMEGKEYLPTIENDDDNYEYVEATIVLCGDAWVSTGKDDLGNDTKHNEGIVMYAKEQKTTQKYLARNPITGRGLGESVTESLYEHQKWHNFTKTEEMRMIAIAGKKLYWTDDPDILSNIFDDGVDHGTVLRVGQGKTFSELNQIPTSVPIYQNMRTEWESSADKVTSSFNSKIGEEAKSGTPFRAQYLQNIEASSQFEQYREEISFLVKDVVEDWVKPDALKDLANEDEIYSSFTPQELQMIDEAIITETVNKEIIKRTLAGIVIGPEVGQELTMKAQDDLRKQGTKRHIKELKEFIKDSGGSVTIHTSDEARNKSVYFESLSNALAILAPEDPRREAIISRILDAIGISKEELEIYGTQPMMQGNPNPKLENKELSRSTMVGADLALAP